MRHPPVLERLLSLLALLALLALPGCASAPDDDDDATADLPPSPGCGKAPVDVVGASQIEEDFGPDADGLRSFHLVLPQTYDPETAYPLIVAYPGTDWMGWQMRGYLGLEDIAGADAIFVYPDPLTREFAGWGTLGGWLLGPNAAPADGDADLRFTEALLDRIEDDYCIDTDRVFVTGHSWGGDMAAVVACVLGERVRAAAPVAANRPYWFEPAEGAMDCPGAPAVWTFFGQADDHFTAQDFPGQYGDEQDAFWRAENGCADPLEEEVLALGAGDECVDYGGCAVQTRYCLYGPATGHQVPTYYAGAVASWFLGQR